MKRIKVGMLVFPGFQLLDIAGPRDAFAEVKILSKGECEYEMLTVGTTRGAVYKTLHDARTKLRKHLVARGLMPTNMKEGM